MSVLVMSDTHGSLESFERCLKVAEHLGPVDLILHCGDVLGHGWRPDPLLPGMEDELAFRLRKLPADRIFFVRGNGDHEEDEAAIGKPLMIAERIVEWRQWRIFMTHGHRESFLATHYKALESGANLWVTGHTHCKKLELADGLIWLNPGSPARPRDGVPSCALLRDDDVLLLDVRSGKVVRKLTREA